MLNICDICCACMEYLVERDHGYYGEFTSGEK